MSAQSCFITFQRPHGNKTDSDSDSDRAASTMEEGQGKVEEGPGAVERGRSRSPVDDEGKKRKRSNSGSSRSSSSSSRSSSSSNSSSSSSSSSEDEAERKKRKKREKKEKKERKKEKERKKKKDKKKKKKKEKKSKKSKDKSKRDDKGGEGGGGKANLNDQFGKYGFIRPSEKFHKQDEFRAWLSEHKQIDWGMLQMRERDELWAEFAEDFNTATLPHVKFYDLFSWEQSSKSKKDAKLRKKLKKASEKGGGSKPTISDEAQREKELQEYRQQKATKEYMTELDTLALEHKAKEAEAMAKIMEMAMRAKK